MNANDVNGKEVVENIVNSAMEKVRERDEVLVAEFKAELRSELDKRDEAFRQQIESRDEAWRQDIESRDEAWRQDIESRDEAWRQDIESRDRALRQEIESRDQALRQDIKERDQKLMLAIEKGGINVWKSSVQWATGTAVTMSGIVIALGVLIAQIISRNP
ncbi:MAG: hypothetical protein ISN28_13955 [Ectothiorhodospiraceae bacterium AqS1]|nr:hypothetical protein [Ectothiorhodospiraceae bacterium AqS1]